MSSRHSITSDFGVITNWSGAILEFIPKIIYDLKVKSCGFFVGYCCLVWDLVKWSSSSTRDGTKVMRVVWWWYKALICLRTWFEVLYFVCLGKRYISVWIDGCQNFTIWVQGGSFMLLEDWFVILKSHCFAFLVVVL